MKYTDEQIQRARHNLTNFVEWKARQVARELGFGWVACDPAPGDMGSLMAAWEHSRLTKEALPVWSGASDNTIYTHALGNWAFRFWHDSLHCKHGLNMTVHDEINIGMKHVHDVVEVFGVGSLEGKFMRQDTIFQSLYCDVHGHFPENQLQFVLDSIRQEQQ